MSNGSFTVAGHELTLDRAKDIIAGYAFATRSVRRKKLEGYADASPEIVNVPRYGYLTYDCLTLGDDFHGRPVLDLVVAAGLNGRVDVDVVGALQQVVPAASAALAKVPDEDGCYFWQLDPAKLKEIPNDGPELHLHMAWAEMMSMPQIGVALTHKVLHHKRPRLFPLLDNITVSELGRSRAWKAIHNDLNTAEEQFLQLESWFLDISPRVELPMETPILVPLYRLRMHDILFWCMATGRDDDAASAGAEIRRGSGE